MRSLQDANRWALHGVDGISTDSIWDVAASPVDAVAGGTPAISTCCTGVDAPVFAAHCVSFAVGQRSASKQEITIHNLSGREKDGQCSEESLWGPSPPDHLFENMLSWLTPRTVRLLEQVPSTDVDRIRSMILSEPLRAKCWCTKHGAWCVMRRAHVNVSGTPCIHHSTMGKKEKMKGKSNRVYYVWARQRREVQEPIFVLENVGQFGEEETQRCLGDLYVIERVMVNCNEQGFCSVRYRQYLVGVLRDFLKASERITIFLDDSTATSSTLSSRVFASSRKRSIE